MNFTIKNNKLVINFSQKLDTSTVLALEKGLTEKIKQEPYPVIFDLEGVEFISSMFLRICMMTFKEKGRDQFTILNAAPQIKSVFMIAGFSEMLS